jgi:membrane protein
MKDQPNPVSGARQFLRDDIWRVRIRDLNRPRRFLIKTAMIVIITLREFAEDKCSLRASALTFYSLLSIVPVVAMIFAIAKGFGFQQHLEQQLLENFSGQEQVIVQVIDFAGNLLETARGGVIAGVGVVVLLWAVISVLGNIEASLNDIWGIKKSRSLGRKFSDYLSIMLIGPVLFVMSSSVTVMIATRLGEITEGTGFLGVFSPLISFVIGILPFCLIWGLFSFIYIFMPHGKINYSSGIIAGIAAGTIFVIVQNLYIVFQVGVARYNAIYGSFAALPLFLVWLQLSWLIVLFGAEISHAHQNVETYEFEPDSKKISPSFRKLLSLQIIHLLVKQFMQGKKPMTSHEISRSLDIPIRLVHDIIHDCMECGLVSPAVLENAKISAYQPARDINDFTIAFILDALENKGTDSIPVAETDSLATLSEALKEFGAAIEKSSANRRLKDI